MEAVSSGQILTERTLCAGPSAGNWGHVSDWDMPCPHPQESRCCGQDIRGGGSRRDLRNPDREGWSRGEGGRGGWGMAAREEKGQLGNGAPSGGIQENDP